jgi:hypothetical protein
MKAKFSAILSIVLLFNNLSPASATTRTLAATVPAILYVAPDGDCLGMTPCYATPQDAVDAAPAGSVIRIAAGSYTPPAGKSQVVQIAKSLILQGGYRLSDWYDAQPFTFPTVLDGQHLGRGMLIDGNPSQPIDVTVDGLQIKNGRASAGGGVSGTGVHLTLQRSIVSDNQATGSGGGLSISNSSSLSLDTSRVISNTAGDTGGGLALNSPISTSTLSQAWVFGNRAAAGGGGLYLSGGQVTLDRVILVDNAVTQPAAAGSGLVAGNAKINLMHLTLARNTGGAGSGLSLSGASVLTATNLLAAGQVVAISITAPSTSTVDGVLWGTGTTWANSANTAGSGSVSVQHAYTGDPLFVSLDPANLKTYFHLGELSPARDRSVSTPAGYRDINNLPAYNTIADLGAAEFYSSGTRIHVDIEPGGDIEVGNADGVPENSQGAMFWNGSQWVTNNTAIHMFYTDIQTHVRLKEYTLVADLNGSSPAHQVIDTYQISRSVYTYVIPFQGEGFYQIEAAQYRITRSDSPEIVLLNSRTNGYGQAAFDIYIQSTTTTTLAFRDGSAWFNYAETSALASRRPMSDLTGRVGILTTCDLQVIDHSRYWLDINGGSDMGGLTYNFHTSTQPNRANTLGTCYPDEFRVKYMQSGTNALLEFRLRPTVYSEKLLPTVYLYLPGVNG